ncbi:MAG: magnesium-translocating P-type ATPase [Dehalococcoidales bacterium]|jgi:Mg2+-importing ATPase
MMANDRRNKKSASAPELVSSVGVVSLQTDEFLSRMGTSIGGLSSEEAAKRLETYGTNEVVRGQKRSGIVEFLLHFRSPITLILIVSAIISAFLGDPLDASIILIIVLVSVTLDFTQEYRANKAAEALKKRVATTATVSRDGTKKELEISELVPGDIVQLSAGDIVPADARIISGKDFFVDQSALTGESFPVEKTIEPVQLPDTADSSKWNNYLFMGTSVTSGTGVAVIVKTGSATEYGEIAKKSAERKPETEFESGLRKFGYLIMQVTFILVIVVFFINALYKHTLIDSLLFSVALAVGLTPGLLPVILSINLSRGATNMSKKGVIVKRLAAIQNFGSMDVLCSDKTGTLTENRVEVNRHVDIEDKESDKVFLYSVLNSRFQTGLRNPMDEAILKHDEINTDQYQKVDEIPFDFIRKRLSIVARLNQQNILITKGAPEEVMKIISQYELRGEVRDLNADSRKLVFNEYLALSNQGFRVLGVAYRNLEVKPSYTVADEINMTFIGFIAFTDPIKETAGESLELLRKAGIKLKILTGDSEIVAGKVCDQLGFQVYQYRRGRKFDTQTGTITRTTEIEPINIVKSSEIENIDDLALARIVEKADIFTRVNPAQKNRIMNALKANGHVVGFIGDGINDTPSMKVADVSISVMNAVDIAKESADIILMKNDLKVLTEGVIEGRKTFGNTLKYIQMAISSNFGNMFSAAGASLFLPFLPMLPIQILLNNLLYSFSQLALPIDNVDETYVQKPQRLRTSFIRNYMIAFGPVSSIFDYATFFVLLVVFHAYSKPSLFQTAWFVESIFTQTLVIFVIRTRTVPFFKSRPNKWLTINIVGLLLIAIILPYTILGKVFKLISLPVSFLFITAGFIVVYLFLVEMMKIWFYRKFAGEAK